jgi:transcriptional regulator with XRE-family HTH domain
MAPTILLGLRALRHKGGFSQTELADAIGVRQATLSEWERGGNVRVDVDVLDALRKALSQRLKRDVTLTELRRAPREKN